MSSLSNSLSRFFTTAALAGTSLLITPPEAKAQSAMAGLGWDLSPDANGYRVHYSNPGETTPAGHFDVGNVNFTYVFNLQDGGHYLFWLQSFNNDGLFSGLTTNNVYGTVVPANGIYNGTPTNDVVLVSNSSGVAQVFGNSGDDRLLCYTNMTSTRLWGQGGRDELTLSNNPLSYNIANGGAHDDALIVRSGRSNVDGGANSDFLIYGWDALLAGQQHSLTNFSLVEEHDFWVTDPQERAHIGDVLIITCVLNYDPLSSNPDNYLKILHSAGTPDAVIRVNPLGTGGPIANYFNFIRLPGFAAQHPGPVINPNTGQRALIDPRTQQPITALSLWNEGNLIFTPEPKPPQYPWP